MGDGVVTVAVGCEGVEGCGGDVGEDVHKGGGPVDPGKIACFLGGGC